MKLKFRLIVKYLQHISAALLALFLCTVAVAQIRFVTVVNEKQAALNDYVEVAYTVENAKSVQKIEPPSFRNFRVIQGPIQSNGMSYINGVMSQYKSVSYILQPIITGKLNIPGAAATIDGREMRSNSVVLDVKKSRVSINPATPPFTPMQPEVEEEYVILPGESVADKIKKNILVKTEVNKTSCYEGEPIMATFKLCSRLRSESRVTKRPSLNGFSVYDMIKPEANNPLVETIDGKPYNVHLIRKTQLFPLQAGTFIIDPVELDNKVRFLHQVNTRSESRSPMQRLMDDFMNEGMHGVVEEHSFSLASKPVTVTVKPLPAVNKPAGFNGAIGKFTVASHLKDASVSAGEAIHLKVRINGQGNFMVINPPVLKLSGNLESYDPAIHEDVDKAIYPLSGSKTFDYTFVAKDTGNVRVPPVLFSYFDPSESKYKTAHSDSFNIRVSAVSKKKRFFRHFILPDPAPGHSSWIDIISIQHLMYIMSAMFVFGIGLFQWNKSRERKKLRSAIQSLTDKNAREMADKPVDPLEGAKWLLREGKSLEFYSEVNKAVWKKLSEILQIPATELNKHNIVVQLHHKGIDEETIRHMESVLNDCEVALYTPVHACSDMQKLLEEAEGVIHAL